MRILLLDGKMTLQEKKNYFSHRLTKSCGVMIGYRVNSNFNANKTSKDNNSRVLIVDAEIGNDAFILINLYNSKVEQLHFFRSLTI